MTIQAGDWVRSYSKGIRQVTRAVPEHYETRYALSAPQKLADRTQFLLKRIVNDKWKPAFAVECAEESLVKALNKADAGKLRRYLADNAEIAEQFESFTKPLDMVLNLGFSLTKKAHFDPFKSEFEAVFAETLRGGLTSDDILRVIAQSPYAAAYGQVPQSATLQFVCHDLEVKRRHFVYRRLNIHPF